MKNSRRMTRLSRIRPKISAINLTSLMDVFTILVFFLIMNSGPTEVLDPPTTSCFRSPSSRRSRARRS